MPENSRRISRRVNPQNKQEDLIGLSRKSLVNQLKSIKNSITQRPPDNNMHGLITENKVSWFLECLGHLVKSHYPYQVYENPALNNGIFPIVKKDTGPVTIALLADWASCTEESIRVAGIAGVQDYSIHLGDTYFVGDSKEISDNFNDTIGGAWPYGTQGSFALLGNHEMYSSGKSYFTELLPYMGVVQADKNILRQEASYFCLENENWRIIGLDTGYDSIKGFLGLTSNMNLTLPEQHLAWLRDVVQPGKDKRGLIFLSHHQPFSAFEGEYQDILPQLTPLLGEDRTVLWFWGHEHRLALYGYNALTANTGCFGRCIGHGGMPVELSDAQLKATTPDSSAVRNLVLYDKRVRKTVDKIDLGHNGCLRLELDGKDLTVKYYDDTFGDNAGTPTPMIEEKWSIDPASGTLTGKSIVDNTGQEPAANRLTQFQSNIQQAVRRGS